MKKLFLLIAVLLISIAIFPQGNTSVDSFTFSTITEALKELISLLNWTYILVFMLATWLINDPTDAVNAADWLTWLSKIPKAIRSFIIGIILIVIFAWAFGLPSRFDVFRMLLSLLVAMVIYKFGIGRAFKWISTRFGLKFDDGTSVKPNP